MQYKQSKSRALPNSNREELIREISCSFNGLPYHYGQGMGADEYLPTMHTLDPFEIVESEGEV